MSCKLHLDEELDQEIYDAGIVVRDMDMTELGLEGHYYRVPGRKPIITLHTGITETKERNVLKTHELGNHYNCICNLFDASPLLQEKYKALSRRWEVRRYMPIEKLIHAFDLGNTTPLALSDYLEIPVDEVMSGIKLYSQIYGATLQHGQYTITWNPFNIKRDRRRRTQY